MKPPSNGWQVNSADRLDESSSQHVVEQFADLLVAAARLDLIILYQLAEDVSGTGWCFQHPPHFGRYFLHAEAFASFDAKRDHIVANLAEQDGVIAGKQGFWIDHMA